MPKRIAIAMFVDACGWGVVNPRPWFMRSLGHRQRVESLFGYSSACVPAILTGRLPNENDHWSSFFYAPDSSPFRPLRHLRGLPGAVFDRGRVRGWLSRAIAKAYGFTGYFQIYNVPFDVLPLFDYAEKKDIFRPGGINRGESVFDALHRDSVRHHVSNWRSTETQNFDALERALRSGNIEFGFLYTAGLDGLMHEVTKDAPAVNDKLRWYEARIGELLATARARFDEVRFALFSDHGMATVTRTVNLVPCIERTGLRFGQDYAAVYDSTMLRFWFLRDGAEDRIRSVLADCRDGRWVSDTEHAAYGTAWPSGRFGHAVYALEPGVVLNPSHMGRVAPRGMHGYRPDHEDSDSTLLANFEPTGPVRRITDLYALMGEMVAWSCAA